MHGIVAFLENRGSPAIPADPDPNHIPAVHRCFYIGYALTAVAQGLTTAQAVYYFRRSKNDRWFMKVIVGGLWLLGFVQFILLGCTTWHWFVHYRSDVDHLDRVPPVFPPSMAITGIVATSVELIYAHRVWRLSFSNRLLTGTIVFFALFGAGSGVAMTTITALFPYWSMTKKNNLSSSLCLSATVIADCIIAISQVYFFHSHRSRSGFGRLKSLMAKLMVNVASAGIITSIVSLMFLLSFVTEPSNGIFIIPYIVLVNCYLNSYFALLNARQKLRDLPCITNEVELETTTGSKPGGLTFRPIVLSAHSEDDEEDERDVRRYPQHTKRTLP